MFLPQTDLWESRVGVGEQSDVVLFVGWFVLLFQVRNGVDGLEGGRGSGEWDGENSQDLPVLELEREGAEEVKGDSGWQLVELGQGMRLLRREDANQMRWTVHCSVVFSRSSPQGRFKGRWFI